VHRQGSRLYARIFSGPRQREFKWRPSAHTVEALAAPRRRHSLGR